MNRKWWDKPLTGKAGHCFQIFCVILIITSIIATCYAMLLLEGTSG